MQDRGARVGDCPCLPLPRGARVYQIFYVSIVLILAKNYNNRTWQNAFFLHDSPPLPAIRHRCPQFAPLPATCLWHPGCPFRAIRPPPLPWITSGTLGCTDTVYNIRHGILMTIMHLKSHEQQHVTLSMYSLRTLVPLWYSRHFKMTPEEILNTHI